HGERAENQGAHRNRLVARDAHTALERTRAAGGQRGKGGGVLHGMAIRGFRWDSPITSTLATRRHLAHIAPGPRLTPAPRGAHGSAVFRQGSAIVAKPELGTKRLCAGCGAKFYDLNKDPIVCPKCSTVFVVAPSARPRPDAARAPVAEEEVAAPEMAEA